MINNTTLVGRLTKDPELRYTGGGIAVTSFTLAVERNYTNAQGERETDFINCVIWREQAENFANFTLKGSLVGIIGNIQTRNYQNNEGQTIYVTEVVASNFQALEPKSVTDARRNGQTQAKPQPQQQNNNPFENVDFNNDDPFETNNATEIDDDSLPF